MTNLLGILILCMTNGGYYPMTNTAQWSMCFSNGLDHPRALLRFPNTRRERFTEYPLVPITVETRYQTNVSERWPTHTEFSQPEYAGNGWWRPVPDTNPTNKWVRTTIQKITDVTVIYEGHQYVSFKMEPVSDVEVKMNLVPITPQWRSTETNDVAGK